MGSVWHLHAHGPLAVLRRASLLNRMGIFLLWSLLLLGLLTGESVPATTSQAPLPPCTLGFSSNRSLSLKMLLYWEPDCVYVLVYVFGGGSSVCEACVLSSQIMQTLTVSCHSHTASESQGAWTSPTDWSWGPEIEDLPQSVPGPLLHLAISSMIVSCFSSLLPLWVTFIVNWAFLSHKWHQ